MQSSLNSAKQDTCTYVGIFGALLSITCLIQHMVITKSHWLTYVMLIVYLYSALSFSLLALMKSKAPLLLAINCGLVLGAATALRLYGVFSAVVFILFIYSAVTVTILYMGEYPRLLAADARARRAESDAWKDKL